MSAKGRLCLFQVIKDECRGQPLRVLEERFVPARQCTVDDARVMFMKRVEDRSFARKHRVLWPDAVRFLDENENEVLRYTHWTYLREITTREQDQDEASPAEMVPEPAPASPALTPAP